MAQMPTELRRGLLVAAMLLFGTIAMAQEDAGEEDAAAPVDQAETDAALADAEEDIIDDPELDAQGFDPTEDDDFVPSEDIPADAPIAFPTDI